MAKYAGLPQPEKARKRKGREKKKYREKGTCRAADETTQALFIWSFRMREHACHNRPELFHPYLLN
jgi:hypothetical protein